MNGINDSKFDNLNITGKDIRIETDFRGYRKDEYGNEIPIHTRRTYLRRYQVLDEDFRSLDIRNWSEKIWEEVLTPRPYPYRSRWWRSGKRKHEHRARGPSFHRRSLQMRSNHDEEYDIPTIRNRTCRNDVWDYYERVHDRHYTCSKCWKDQKKVRHQWQVHTA